MKSELEKKNEKTAAEIKAKSELIRAEMSRYMDLYHMNKAELAIKSGIGLATLYSRFKQPEDFTQGELIRICEVFYISLTELFSGTLKAV
jgi:predicted transcriptional regulator